MTIKEFDKKYKEQGGIKQLSMMKDNFETLKKISECFKVSKERVRQWMIIFFGEKYDPRYERRENKIKAIKTLIEKYGIEKTKALCSGTNKDYLQIAINNSQK